MKKLILALILLLILPVQAFATVGTVTQTLTTTCGSDPQGTPCQKVLTLVCTADVSAATYPSTAITAAIMEQIKGWLLFTGSALNGATGPTASSVIKLSTTTQGDILGGAGKTATAATAAAESKFLPIGDTVYLTPKAIPVVGDLTFTITGNAVNSALVTVVLTFIK